MEEASNNTGGIWVAIADAAAEVLVSIVDAVTFGKRARYERLPDWIDITKFQRKDYTTTIIAIGMFVVLIVVVIAIIKAKK